MFLTQLKVYILILKTLKLIRKKKDLSSSRLLWRLFVLKFQALEGLKFQNKQTPKQTTRTLVNLRQLFQIFSPKVNHFLVSKKIREIDLK